MQQRPPSANTRAPASNIHSPEIFSNVLQQEKYIHTNIYKAKTIEMPKLSAQINENIYSVRHRMDLNDTYRETK